MNDDNWNELTEDQLSIVLRLIRSSSPKQLAYIIEQTKIHKSFLKDWSKLDLD